MLKKLCLPDILAFGSSTKLKCNVVRMNNRGDSMLRLVGRENAMSFQKSIRL